MEVELHNLPSIHNANNAASSRQQRGLNHASIDIICTVSQGDRREEFHGQKSSQLFSFSKNKKIWKHVDSNTFLKRNFYLSLKISMVTTWLATEIRIPTKQEYFSGVLLAKSREITKLSPEI